jgi:hypothetical protein
MRRRRNRSSNRNRSVRIQLFEGAGLGDAPRPAAFSGSSQSILGAAIFAIGAICVNLLGRMKDIYVSDLMGFDEGKLFDGFFLVLAKQQRTTKQNKAYLNLTLGDKTGQMEARVWELGNPRIAKDFDRGDMVKVRGSISRYDDRAQMKVDQLRKAQASEADKLDMLPADQPGRGRFVAPA